MRVRVEHVWRENATALCRAVLVLSLWGGQMAAASFDKHDAAFKPHTMENRTARRAYVAGHQKWFCATMTKEVP